MSKENQQQTHHIDNLVLASGGDRNFNVRDIMVLCLLPLLDQLTKTSAQYFDVVKGPAGSESSTVDGGDGTVARHCCCLHQLEPQGEVLADLATRGGDSVRTPRSVTGRDGGLVVDTGLGAETLYGSVQLPCRGREVSARTGHGNVCWRVVLMDSPGDMAQANGEPEQLRHSIMHGHGHKRSSNVCSHFIACNGAEQRQFF
jgi:hypothetical protein